MVLTAGEAEISDGGTEGGGGPRVWTAPAFFRKSSKNKENVKRHPDLCVASCKYEIRRI